MYTTKAEKTRIKIGGMTCINCQSKIQRRLQKLRGVLGANVSWEKGEAGLCFDESLISLDEIKEEIEKLGYKVLEKQGKSRLFSGIFYLVLIALIFMILQKTGLLNILVPSSLASSKMSYGLLFVTGLLTSVHCVAMCGGINLSQSLPNNQKKTGGREIFQPLFYNLGRVTSYTLIGLALGTAGFFLSGGKSDDFALPFSLQGILKIIAGLLMLFMGISLLGIFPFLRHFTPHLPAFLAGKVSSAQVKNARPFIVGFLNGFMPCGPLQAMWIVSLAAANPLSGALSMLLFSLGTLPLMLALGSFVSVLGKKYREVVMKIGAVLVVVMALSMMSQGFALGGWNFGGKNLSGGEERLVSQSGEEKSSAKGEEKSLDGKKIEMTEGKQIVKSILNPYRYPAITVKKGIPVHWEIEAPENALNGCNYKMIFRDFGFAYEMDYGTNVIEFTPEQAGTFQYTCWMGMVRGFIKVEE